MTNQIKVYNTQHKRKRPVVSFTMSEDLYLLVETYAVQTDKTKSKVFEVIAELGLKKSSVEEILNELEK